MSEEVSPFLGCFTHGFPQQCSVLQEGNLGDGDIYIYRYIEWDATNDSPKRYWYITTFFHKLLKNVVLNGTRWDKT